MRKLYFIVVALVLLGATSFTLQNDEGLMKRAEALHKVMFTIDTHNDTAVYLNHPDKKSNLIEKQYALL